MMPPAPARTKPPSAPPRTKPPSAPLRAKPISAAPPLAAPAPLYGTPASLAATVHEAPAVPIPRSGWDVPSASPMNPHPHAGLLPAERRSPQSIAAANEPTMRPSAIDPAMAQRYGGEIADSAGLGTPMPPPPRLAQAAEPQRPRLPIAAWVVIGAIVIGGGVFAGIQIRALRFHKKLAAREKLATEVAQADTWTGWNAARECYAQIVGAADSVENRAKLARTRSVLAYEFGDELSDAKAAVDGLGSARGLDRDLAVAYLALAQGDASAANSAAQAALSDAPQDPAALYVAGSAASLGGDLKSAATYLREAFQHDTRPLYGVALARTLAATCAWDEAIATLDRVLAASADHPAAVIERARVLAQSGRVSAASGMGVHAQIEKVIAEASKPVADQPHGVSPVQLAIANLVLARVDFARGDRTTAYRDLNAAAHVGIDEQRFAEESIETLEALGDLPRASRAADRALQTWPQSRRARIALAEVQLATGKPSDVLTTLERGDAVALPLGLAVRGQAKLALGDEPGARADIEAALKKVPALEAAIVGDVRLELAAGDVANARKLIEPHLTSAMSPTSELEIAYAAVLGASDDVSSRDKAKALLEKVVAGAPTAAMSRAQLELARLDRDVGDFRAAGLAYAEAIKAGSYEARVENGLMLLDNHEPAAGHEALESLWRDQGGRAPANLAIDVARARMLVGDNAGAAQLLGIAAKTGKGATWKLAREQGRLALRKGDFAAAANVLGHALETCGGDPETFLLAADVATSDDKQASAVADKIGKLWPDRLKGQPEASIVEGKLLIAAKKYADADAAFVKARDALAAIKASARRQAQAHFGRAVAKYNASDDVEARSELELVIVMDPTLYTAYLYQAFLVQDKQRAKAYELAKRAAELDPDSVDAWLLEGQLASKLGDNKTFTVALGRLAAIAPTSDQYKQLLALRR
jgi:predicted Zn-dependent protease